MRHARLKITGRAACYHVLSRTVEGERLSDDNAKGVFQKQLRQGAAICGIEVLKNKFTQQNVNLFLSTP